MACELDGLLVEAWEKVKPFVMGTPGELEARLARRRTRMFERVPRALCLAVRANDHRLTPMMAAMRPGCAVEKGAEREHEAVLDASLLVYLCRPVEIAWPGEEVSEVGRYLGCGDSGLKAARRDGVVRERFYRGLGGKRGKPVPVVYTERPMDACAKGKGAPDRLVEAMWKELAGRVAGREIEQAVVRRPTFGIRRGKERFMGWRWVCPGCGAEVRTLYYPMGAVDWARVHGIELGKGEELAAPAECFGCVKCHGVVNLTRTEGGIRRCWNQIVLHVSGGLLYGREVRRPDWFTVERKRKYVARAMEKPRRAELKRWLLETELDLGEIARRMGLKRDSVRTMACWVYRECGVKRRKGLKEKCGGLGAEI